MIPHLPFYRTRTDPIFLTSSQPNDAPDADEEAESTIKPDARSSDQWTHERVDQKADRSL